MSIAPVIIKTLVSKSNLFFQYSAIVESFDFFPVLPKLLQLCNC